MAAKKKRRINEPKYMFTGLCYLIRYPLLLAGLATLVYGSLNPHKAIYPTGIALLIAFAICFLSFFMNSKSVSCRLCRAQFFKKLRCVRKSDAPSILGNVRAPLALSMITRKSSIKCPYCGEKHPYFGKR